MTRAKTDNGTVPPLLPLEAAEAAIHTTTITIRALQVGKKQMTQSVFRQLPWAELVDDVEVKLNGVVWGHVNYRWGEIDAGCHNFVFQKGGELYRCDFLVRSAPYQYYDKYGAHRAGGLDRLRGRYRNECVAAFCAKILEGRHKPSDSYSSERWGERWDLSFGCDPLIFHESISPKEVASLRDDKVAELYGGSGVAYVLDSLTKNPGPEDLTKSECDYIDRWTKDAGEKEPRRRAKVEEKRRANAKLLEGQTTVLGLLRREVVKRTGSLLTSDQILARMAEIERQAIDFNRRWDALMDQLRTVEQLFIAV